MNKNIEGIIAVIKARINFRCFCLINNITKPDGRTKAQIYASHERLMREFNHNLAQLREVVKEANELA